MPFLKSKWTALFLSNFLSVFNDNFLKNCIIFIAIGWSLPAWMSQSQLISIVSASLIIPYLFLSPLAGRFAVIYSKKWVFRTCKLLEIPVLILACVAFFYQWVMVAIFSVLLMGILSCMYSPAKYSLIRDIGGEAGVSFGSGIFEMMAFLGILVGTVVASIVADFYQYWLLVLILIGLGVFGFVSAKSIKTNELPQNKDKVGTLSPISFLSDTYQFSKQYSHVNSAVFGASAFWLIGGMLQMNLVIHTQHIYHASNSITGLIMACAAIGIAVGCWAAGKISGNEVKKGLILIGIIGMSLLFAVLTFCKLNIVFFSITVFWVAFMGGIFQIPCLSILQNANLGRKLGDIIGYLNLVTFVFVLLGTLFFSITTYISGENSYAVFGVILIFCLVVSLFFLLSSTEFRKATKALF